MSNFIVYSASVLAALEAEGTQVRVNPVVFDQPKKSQLWKFTRQISGDLSEWGYRIHSLIDPQLALQVDGDLWSKQESPTENADIIVGQRLILDSTASMPLVFIAWEEFFAGYRIELSFGGSLPFLVFDVRDQQGTEVFLELRKPQTNNLFQRWFILPGEPDAPQFDIEIDTRAEKHYVQPTHGTPLQMKCTNFPRNSKVSFTYMGLPNWGENATFPLTLNDAVYNDPLLNRVYDTGDGDFTAYDFAPYMGPLAEGYPPDQPVTVIAELRGDDDERTLVAFTSAPKSYWVTRTASDM